MDKILVVEDSKFFSNLTKQRLENELGFSVIVVETMKAAKLVLDVRREDFFIALLDLTLPDAYDDEIVELANSYNLPSVIFSSTLTDSIYNKMHEYDIVDYIIKDNPSALDYLVSLVNRFKNNENIRVLVVDDNGVQRKLAVNMLERHNLTVLQA